MTLTFSKYIILAALFLGMVFTASFAYAEEGDSSDDSETQTTELQREPFGPLPSDRQEAFKERREAMEEHMDEKRELSDEQQEHREDFMEKRDELREKVDEKREHASTTIQERRDELRAKGLENARDRIVRNVKRFIRILNAGGERAEKFIDRIEARMTELEENGTDTSIAAGHIEDAQTSLADMYLKIGDIEGESTLNASSTPKEQIAAIKEILRGAKDDLKSAMSSIRDAIKSLKPADDSDEDSDENESTDN